MCGQEGCVGHPCTLSGGPGKLKGLAVVWSFLKLPSGVLEAPCRWKSGELVPVLDSSEDLALLHFSLPGSSR